MISGFIKGQELTLTSPIIASGTIDYLSANFIFFTNEWKDLDEIWVHFQKGDNIYDAKVVNGKVDKTEHINLDNGEWYVYLHGNEIVDGEVIQRITTEKQKLFVKESGVLSGEVFPTVDASTSEKFLAKANYAVEFAEKLKQDLENGKYSYQLTDEDVQNIVDIVLADVGENSGYIPSVTSFPEVANNGDAVLLHRCNEISADDANSAVILDTTAIALLGLPEGYVQRTWEFEAKDASGKGFYLNLEIKRITVDEEYTLTALYIVSETYADRWYWKDGELATDIANASAKPVPVCIPLGNVDSFAAAKTLYNEVYLGFDDTDETVVFRTIPQHYIAVNGSWQLAERTDAAEGAIIGNVIDVEKDGKLYLRLRLTDSRSLSLSKTLPNYIDIPVSAINSSTATEGGLTLNGAELDFGTGDLNNDILENFSEDEDGNLLYKGESIGSGDGISGVVKVVSALPETATEGDVVYYCPPANTLTMADSGGRIYIDLEGIEKFGEYIVQNPNLNDFQIAYNINSYGVITVDFFGGYDENGVYYKLFCIAIQYNDTNGDTIEAVSVWHLKDEAFSFDNHYALVGGAETQISTPSKYYDLVEFDESFELFENTAPEDFSFFYVNPRYYRYTNGAWVEIKTGCADIAETEDIRTAVEEIRGGIDEIEALIDDSGVLE